MVMVSVKAMAMDSGRAVARVRASAKSHAAVMIRILVTFL